jgi:hypothetical protein
MYFYHYYLFIDIPIVAVEPISRGSEVFVSYNYGPGTNLDWFRRQYEALVAQGLHHLYSDKHQQQCSSN